MSRRLSLEDVLNYEALPPEVRDLAERYLADKRPPAAPSEDRSDEWYIGYDEGYSEGYADGMEDNRHPPQKTPVVTNVGAPSA